MDYGEKVLTEVLQDVRQMTPKEYEKLYEESIMESKLKELKEEIALIPRDGEWWHSSGEDAFIMLGETLLKKGFSVTEASEFLDKAYYAVAAEFGN